MPPSRPMLQKRNSAPRREIRLEEKQAHPVDGEGHRPQPEAGQVRVLYWPGQPLFRVRSAAFNVPDGDDRQRQADQPSPCQGNEYTEWIGLVKPEQDARDHRNGRNDQSVGSAQASHFLFRPPPNSASSRPSPLRACRSRYSSVKGFDGRGRRLIPPRGMADFESAFVLLADSEYREWSPPFAATLRVVDPLSELTVRLLFRFGK